MHIHTLNTILYIDKGDRRLLKIWTALLDVLHQTKIIFCPQRDSHEPPFKSQNTLR